MNRALALLRPVSMSDETASDWLAAAIAETADMPDALFRQGVSEARKSCTFHGQLVPAIRAPQKRVDDYRASLGMPSISYKPDNVRQLAGPRRGNAVLGDVLQRVDVVKRIGRE